MFLDLSFVEYAYNKSKNDYDLYLDEPIEESTWEFINSDSSVKEGLYASKYPINPYSIKNLNDFLVKWNEEDKSDEFIQQYKNVALGLSIDENGTEMDLKVRIAKVLDSGKMLKINDPAPVDSDSTRYRVWIDPSDNNIFSIIVFIHLYRQWL